MATLIPRFLGPLPLDVVVTEQHTSEVTATKIPVEFGADITDHAYVEPRTLVLQGVVGGRLSRGSVVFGSLTALPAAGFQLLRQFQKTRIPFVIITGLDVYTNMLITKIDVERDKENASVFQFTATCSEILLVNTSSAAATLDAPENGQATKLGNGTPRSNVSVGRGSSVLKDASVDTTVPRGALRAEALSQAGAS